MEERLKRIFEVIKETSKDLEISCLAEAVLVENWENVTYWISTLRHEKEMGRRLSF